ERIRTPDGGRLRNIGAIERGSLDLCRPDTIARHLDGVVGTAQDVPERVLIDQGPITVYPDVGPARPVGLQVSLRVFPPSERHAQVGAADHELPDLAPNWLPALVEDGRIDAGDRTRKAAGF